MESTRRVTHLQTPAIDEEMRLAPHNIEAEQALLGAILNRNTVYDKVSSFLEPQHFYDPVHGRIYEVLARQISRGHHVTPVTLKTFFERDQGLQEIGGTEYIARLYASAVSLIGAEQYGHLIYDLAVRRELIEIGEEIVLKAYDSSLDANPQDQIEEAESALYSVAESKRYEGGFQSFDQALREAVDMAAAAYQRDGGLSGLSTGLIDLDRRLGGLQPSDLVILAARPSMGKTALAANIAFNVASKFRHAEDGDDKKAAADGGRVAFFSLEMSSEQLATRLLAEQASISSSKIRRGQIHEEEFQNLVDAAARLEAAPLFIDDTGGISIAQLAARARRLKRQKGLELIVVDYLQLVTPSGYKRTDGRVQEVSEITQGLKALAKELDVPIIALSQLSRAVEQRDDKRPQLADLRESGSIEQDADVVMFVYREAYYKERLKPAEGTEEFFKWQAEMAEVQNLAEVIVAKQRHGPIGTVHLQFTGEFTRFSNLDQVHQPDDSF